MVYSDCGSSASSTYHITFTIICSLTTLNLIIAVILFAFFDFSESAKRPTLEGDKIARFEDAWSNFDKNAEGELPQSLVQKLILANGLPLGTKKFADAEDLEQELWESGLLLDRNGKIQFRELLHAMVFVAFGVNCKQIEDQNREARRVRKLGLGGDNSVVATPMLAPESPSFRDPSDNEDAPESRSLERDLVRVAPSDDATVSNIEDQEPMSPSSPVPDQPVMLNDLHPLSPVTPVVRAEGDGGSLLPAPVSVPPADVAQAMENVQEQHDSSSADAPGRPQP
jgi:hypothetical protein